MPPNGTGDTVAVLVTARPACLAVGFPGAPSAGAKRCWSPGSQRVLPSPSSGGTSISLEMAAAAACSCQGSRLRDSGTAASLLKPALRDSAGATSPRRTAPLLAAKPLRAETRRGPGALRQPGWEILRSPSLLGLDRDHRVLGTASPCRRLPPAPRGCLSPLG